MEKIKLYMSLRSPFARRTRVLVEELGVAYEPMVVDVFQPTAEFIAINPLGRVPVVVLSNREILPDSCEIQNYFRTRFSTHSIFLAHGASEASVRRLSGLATGIMDWCVVAFLETLRAPGMQSQSVRADAIESIVRTLRVIDQEFKGSYLLGEHFGVWDIDMGAALAYCDLRIGVEVVNAFPRLRKYLEMLSQRPSFQKTIPPK